MDAMTSIDLDLSLFAGSYFVQAEELLEVPEEEQWSCLI